MAFKRFKLSDEPKILYTIRNGSSGGGEAGSSLDADAQAFLDATGITDETIEGAIDVFVTTLKTDGIWAKSYAIYPFVGGTADAHHYNLKDPQDTDAAFRIDLWANVSHDSGGVHPDIHSTTAHGRTTFSPSADLSSDSMMFTTCVGDRGTNDGYVMGCIGSPSMIQRDTIVGGFFPSLNIINDGLGVADGCASFGNDDVDSRIYKNGSWLKTLVESWTPPAAVVYAVAGPGKADLGPHLFSAITESLDATEVANFHTAIDTLNNTLSRKTW